MSGLSNLSARLDPWARTGPVRVSAEFALWKFYEWACGIGQLAPSQLFYTNSKRAWVGRLLWGLAGWGFCEHCVDARTGQTL